jgi:hypothetical protein
MLGGQNMSNSKHPVLLGEGPLAVSRRRATQWHPCPRFELHLRWLVTEFAKPEHVILDPFMGGGSTLRAAKDLQRTAIGIEIKEQHCEAAAKSLEQEIMNLDHQKKPLAKDPA